MVREAIPHCLAPAKIGDASKSQETVNPVAFRIAEFQNYNNGFQRPMICSIEHCLDWVVIFYQIFSLENWQKKQDFQFSKVPPYTIQVRLSVLNCFQRQRFLFFWQYIDYLRAILIMMVISDALSILC